MTDDLARLAADLGRAPLKLATEAAAIVKRGATNIKNDWRKNATETAGKHGRLYPLSIDYEMHGLSAEIGPDASKPQGGMGPGFEYGSANQPPHWDGKRAADAEEPRFQAALEKAIGGLL